MSKGQALVHFLREKAQSYPADIEVMLWNLSDADFAEFERKWKDGDNAG